MKFLLIFILIFFLMKPVWAGGGFFDSLPQPITNFYETLSNIRIFSELGDITGLWDKINDWFEDKIGVSFRTMLIALSDLVVWILELIIKIVRSMAGFVT